MPYGSATVRPYVGAVKSLILPIVALAINRTDAPLFHNGRGDCLLASRHLRGKPYADAFKPKPGRPLARFLSSFRLGFSSTAGQAKQTCAAPRRPAAPCEFMCGDCGDLARVGSARTDCDPDCSDRGRELCASDCDRSEVAIGAEAGQSPPSLIGT